MPLQGVFADITASISIYLAKLDVGLVSVCLQRRFSVLHTYFYMKIKFPLRWFGTMFSYIKDMRFPVI